METKQTQQQNGSPQLTINAAYSKAIEHFNAGRYEEVDKLCTAIVQARPNHIDAINLLGLVAQKINRHDLAVEQFQHALQFNSSRSVLHHNLGISFHQLGRSEEAILALQTALEKDPGNSKITAYLNAILNKTTPSAKAVDETSTVRQQPRPAVDAGQADDNQQADEPVKTHRDTLHKTDEKPSRTATETSGYYRTDKYGTIKITRPLWLIILFSMRYMLVIFLGSVGHLPELSALVLSQPFMVAGGIPAVTLIAADFNRLPHLDFNWLWSKVWKKGQWLLMGGIVLDLLMTLIFRQEYITRLELFTLTSLALDPLIVFYLFRSHSAKTLFASFPPPPEPVLKEK
jgi:hypothetical protein